VTKILLFGATSVIAHETAKCFADRGDAFFLVARNKERLELVADDLRQRGASQVETALIDALDYDQHACLAARAAEQMGGLDVAIIAHGTLPNQKACQASFEETRRELEVNALSVISLLTCLCNYFEARRCGTVAVFCSVAADRGRQSNYVYCTAKGAVDVFLEGLRNRLHPAGVSVVTLKIGRVDTPMTASFEKGVFWARPSTVAVEIYRAIERRKDVAYVPWYWRGIMMVIRAIPERLFKRLRL
jgi:short-subunit dehydrogenase